MKAKRVIKRVDYLIQTFDADGLIVGDHRQAQNSNRQPSIVN